MYVDSVAGATVSMPVVCLCRVLPMIRPVGFIFAAFKSFSAKFSSSDGRTKRNRTAKAKAEPWRFYVCYHLELLASEFLVQCVLKWSERSFGWRVSLLRWSDYRQHISFCCSHLLFAASLSAGSWSCSLANLLLLSSVPPGSHNLPPTPSSPSCTNAAQKGFQEIHRRRGRPSAP